MIKNTIIILLAGVIGTLAGIHYGGRIKDIAQNKIERIIK